jgi:ABC-type nitrate/sulfonate/bicarbonate transport system permease component
VKQTSGSRIKIENGPGETEAPVGQASDSFPGGYGGPSPGETTVAGTVAVHPRRGAMGLRRAASRRTLYKVVGLLSVIGGLALWQVLASTGAIDRSLSSSPADVWTSARQLTSSGTLGSAVLSSAQLYGLGLAISIAIGIILGMVLGWWRLLGAIFDPWIAILYSTPLIALLPLILVWFGIGFQGQIVMVILVSVFPLLVNVMTGSRQVDTALLRLAKSFGASQLAVLRSLVLPSLVPYIVTGVRLSVGTALIGVVLAEYFEGSGGIGGLILKAGVQLDSAEVFVGIVVLAGTALTLTSLIRVIERRISSWREL